MGISGYYFQKRREERLPRYATVWEQQVGWIGGSVSRVVSKPPTAEWLFSHTAIVYVELIFSIII